MSAVRSNMMANKAPDKIPAGPKLDAFHNASLTPLLVKDFNALPSAKVRFVEPMYALAVQTLPQGQEWLYEVKFDGYRCLAGRDAGGAALWSRRENLFTKQFPQITQACERLPLNTLVDGEIVALDEKGRVSFNLLQHHRSKAQALVFYAFDVLIYRGRSVLNVPLYFRREVLRRIFEDINAAPIGLSENIEAAPTDMNRVAKEFGFEGIVAKRKDSLSSRASEPGHGSSTGSTGGGNL
jgi:ATP-dependent DNA ligase